MKKLFRIAIYFIVLNALFIYSTNVLVKKYYSSVYPKSKNSKKLFIITIKSRLNRILTQFEQAQDFVGEIVAITVVDDPFFESQEFNVVAEKDMIEYATRAVVDEVFVNVPSELYKLDKLVSQLWELIRLLISMPWTSQPIVRKRFGKLQASM